MEFLNVGGVEWEELALSQNVIHMGHNCNQLELDPSINEVMAETVRRDSYRNYTPPYGFEELQALMLQDVGVAEKGIMVTQGASEAIFQAMFTVLTPGSQTIVSDPGWPHIGNFARSIGSQVIEVPVYGNDSGYKLTPDLVREHMSPSVRLIAVVDPLNPTGGAYTEAEIKELCRIAEENDAWLLHDATYRDFAKAGFYPAVNYSARAIMNISLSKVCGFAGLRVGASIADRRVIEWIKANQVARLGGNWVAQQGAIAAYKSKGKWLSRVLETNRANQRLIEEAVDAVPELEVLVPAGAGNFVAIDVSGTGRSSEDFVSAALKEGFVLRSGNYTSPRFGNQFIRITTTVDPDDVTKLCGTLPQIMHRLREQ